jgi:outer membrane protein OmpU
MKKLLLATSILAGTAGMAAAEINFSGSAVMGVGDEGSSADVRSILEAYLTAEARGTTDGGLEFGFDMTMATFDSDVADIENDGTTVFISGAFGKLSMGSVTEADEVATLSDIGLVGIGLDNIAESYSGDSAGRETHDVNYTYSGGPLMAAISAHIGAAGEGDGYAVGLKYTFGDAYVGIGYNDDNVSAAAGTVTSLYAGGTFGAFGVTAMYSEWNPDAAIPNEDSYGIRATYTVDALTVAAMVADGSAETDASYGLGASYDLGGGAKVIGGVGDVQSETVWDLGLSFEF